MGRRLNARLQPGLGLRSPCSRVSNSAYTPTLRPSDDGHAISLLDLDPELRGLLTEEERDGVSAIGLTTRTFSDERTGLKAEFRRAGAFGAFVIKGVLIHEVRLADRTGMRLLGPGDVLAYPNGFDPYVLGATRWLPAGPVQLAMFDNRLLLALRRWPRLMVGLYMRLGQQLDRLTAQLVICQLPRVEDRVLGIMWLMAESWGKVTPAGTRLPLHLTHETIGMMIGARRPTVSLALRELAERGAMVRHGSGWLLLEPLASMGELSPEPTDDGPVPTRAQVVPDPELSNMRLPLVEPGLGEESLAALGAALHESVAALGDQHGRNVAKFHRKMADARAIRIESKRIREQAARQRVRSLRQTPS